MHGTSYIRTYVRMKAMYRYEKYVIVIRNMGMSASPDMNAKSPRATSPRESVHIRSALVMTNYVCRHS